MFEEGPPAGDVHGEVVDDSGQVDGLPRLVQQPPDAAHETQVALQTKVQALQTTTWHEKGKAYIYQEQYDRRLVASRDISVLCFVR